MKHFIKYFIVITVFLFLIPGVIPAADMYHSPSSHDMKAMDQMDAMDMEHDGHGGEMIRKTVVDGYQLMYHIIDMKAQMEKMNAAGHAHEMKNTHHLMVYVTDANGRPVENARVGYLIQTPDDEKQKAMCMAMAGGFGADVDFSAHGTFKVKSKIVVGEKTLMDTFEYKAH